MHKLFTNIDNVRNITYIDIIWMNRRVYRKGDGSLCMSRHIHCSLKKCSISTSSHFPICLLHFILCQKEPVLILSVTIPSFSVICDDSAKKKVRDFSKERKGVIVQTTFRGTKTLLIAFLFKICF